MESCFQLDTRLKQDRPLQLDQRAHQGRHPHPALHANIRLRHGHRPGEGHQQRGGWVLLTKLGMTEALHTMLTSALGQYLGSPEQDQPFPTDPTFTNAFRPPPPPDSDPPPPSPPSKTSSPPPLPALGLFGFTLLLRVYDISGLLLLQVSRTRDAFELLFILLIYCVLWVTAA